MSDKANLKNIEIEKEYVGFQTHIVQMDKHAVSKCLVKTDEKRNQQVLLNILSNALKFTPKNGKIKLKIENV